MAGQVRFTETMQGWLSPQVGATHEAAAEAGQRAGTPGSFTLTVLTLDVDAMIADPDHRSPAFGLLECPALDAVPLAVHAGALDLFADAAPGVVHMRYRLDVAARDGRRFVLRGVKEVVRRRWFPTALIDTTTLFVDVWAGDAPVGPPALRGIFWMGPPAVFAQGLSFRGGPGAIVRYLAYYVRRCVQVYLGPRTAPLRPGWSRATD